jgi:hypothetical protein
MIYLDQRI